jgi:hypothetical protein
MADHSPQRQDSQDSASPKGVGGRKSSKMPGYVSRCFDTEAGLSGSDSSDEDDASGSDISRLFADSDGDESDGSCCARLAFGPGSPMAGGSEWPVGRTGGGTPIVPVTGPGLPGRDSAQGLGTCAGPLDAVASVEAGAQAAKPSKRKRAPKKPRTGGLRQPAPVGNPLPVADAASVDNRRARHWLFTVNNYADSDIDQLKVLGLSSQVGYLCWQREIGGGAGVPHLQGYVSFKESVPLRTVKTRVGNRAHLLMANGSAEDNIAYCSKSDTRDETDPSYCFVECAPDLDPVWEHKEDGPMSKKSRFSCRPDPTSGPSSMPTAVLTSAITAESPLPWPSAKKNEISKLSLSGCTEIRVLGNPDSHTIE